MEFMDSSPGIQIVPGDPLVVEVVVTSPLDKIFNMVVVNMGVEYFSQFEMLNLGVAVDDN